MREEIEKICGYCIFYNGGSMEGKCWRYPPVWTPNGWRRPTVLVQSDCGEWDGGPDKYDRLKAELDQGKEGSMKVYGKSMEPIIYSGAKLTFKPSKDYEIDDVVFCKVEDRIIDAHKITGIREKNGVKEYLIANNHGYVNGWTSVIYGKVMRNELSP